MNLLRFTTLQAPNQDFIIREVSAHLGERLGVQTEFVIDMDWQTREHLLDAGEIEVAWICGLPYVRRAGHPDCTLELLAAPVMQAPRYQNRPVYYSDVLVRRESAFQKFTHLRGARWAYNEPNSQSGYHITCFTLARLNTDGRFFGSAIQAGSHQRALEMLLAGEIDAAAIDSTVLELEVDREPRITTELRAIDSLGPSPIPPLVINRRVEAALREEIRTALLEMHLDPSGAAILARGNIRRFAAVQDRDYDPIREMARLSAGIHL